MNRMDNMYKIKKKPFAEIKKEKCTDCIHEKNGECTKYGLPVPEYGDYRYTFCEYYLHIKDYLDKSVKGYA